MSKRKVIRIVTAALVGGVMISSVAAQPFGSPPYGAAPYGQYRENRGPSPEEAYREGFRQGYRSGYDNGRTRRPYDDTDYNYGYSYDYSRRDATREDRWRQRYSQIYSYNDDNFYQECRQSPDPAGVIVGALIGGILGNSVASGGARGGATVAGVIAGGALGAALTRNLDCDDRSYAYKSYYDAFNAGRPNARYQWRNPRSGRYGDFLVRDYYNDPDGFRCANFTQQIFIQGRPQAASGRACQQPDGTWAIVG